MSLEGVDSDCTIPQQQQPEGTRPTKPHHSRRLRTVNWIPSSESETFNTVVFNYRYNMEHSKAKKIPRENKIENKKPHQQKEQALEKHLNLTNSVEEKESLSEFYLCKLYEESLQDLVKKTIEMEKAKKEDETKDVIIKNIIQEKGNPEKTHIILEITTPLDNATEAYHTPPTELESTTLPKPVRPFEPNEIIVISDDEDEDEEFTFCLPNTPSFTNQNLTTSCMECKIKAKHKPETVATIATEPPTHSSKATTTTSHNLKTLQSKLREILDPEKMVKEEKLKLKITTVPKSSSEFLNQKLKLKMPTSPNTFKNRQLELHRQRIAVEVKRLELLEVKLARERDEMMREQILFEKELELKNSQIKQIKENL